MSSARSERACTAGVFVLALLFMSAGLWRGFEWSDEGQIVYPSWRVARGALPYRDFYHLYGPALFMFNGELFRLFGADLWVTRAALLVVKSTVAVLTYAASRAVAGRLVGSFAALLTIVVWGSPGWVFTTPYANHYAVALILLALVVHLRLRSRFVLACAAAGLCCGMAALFKQTSGLFALCGVGLYLVWDTAPGVVRRFPGGEAGARAVRIVFLLATLALFIQYLRPVNTAWNVGMLLSPAALTIVLLGLRELRGTVTAPQRGAWGLIAAGSGAALAVGSCAAYFALHGALGALVFNTVTHGPKLLDWFEPLPVPPRPVMLLMGLALAAAAFERRSRVGEPPAVRHRARIASLVAAAAALVVFASLLGDPGWQWILVWGVGLVPFVAVWGMLPAMFPETVARARHRPGATPSAAAGLFYCTAVVSLLYFYPAGDVFHLFMSLPLFLPLAAAAAARWVEPRTAAQRPGPIAYAVAATLIVTVLFAPFVSLLASGLRQPLSPATFSRATAIRASGTPFDETVELVRYLATLPPDRPLLVLANNQLLYFLSGRDSAVARDEFLLYLVGFDLIREEDIHRYLPEAALIERLGATRPIVIDGVDTRFRQQLPDTSRFVDDHYEILRVFGPYRVLGWEG
jgi:hypothetical protein